MNTKSMNGSKKQNMESEEADRRVAALQGALHAGNFAMGSFICIFIYMPMEGIGDCYEARAFVGSGVTIRDDPRVSVVV